MQVCGISGDPWTSSVVDSREYNDSYGKTRFHAPTPKVVGLVDSGANLCMTHDPLLLVDVRPCPPFSIGLATYGGSPSSSAVCRYRGLLPVPLLDGTYHYQPCYVSPHSLDTFISAQAIIDASDGLFDHWRLDGYASGRPGCLAIYSPSGLLKISILLVSHEGLHYCETDMFTLETDPRLLAITRQTCKLDIASHTVPHLVEDNNDSDDDKDDDDDEDPVATGIDKDNIVLDDSAVITTPTDNYAEGTTSAAPRSVRRKAAPRSRITIRPTNRARQLKSELWAARLGHCGEDQLKRLAQHADRLPTSFEFHPFRFIDWRAQARIWKQAAGCKERKAPDVGVRFYIDFGFMRASNTNFTRPNLQSDRVVLSYDGYNSYLLIVDNKLAMTWVFLTRSKEPPLTIVRLFLRTFGRPDGGFIRCDQGGELGRSPAFVKMCAEEFQYLVEPTGADSTSQSGQAEKWNDVFAVTTRALLYSAALGLAYWSAALLHGVYLHNRRVHSRTGRTPFESWWGSRLNLRYLNSLALGYASNRPGIVAPSWINTTSLVSSLGIPPPTRTSDTWT